MGYSAIDEMHELKPSLGAHLIPLVRPSVPDTNGKADPIPFPSSQAMLHHVSDAADQVPGLLCASSCGDWKDYYKAAQDTKDFLGFF